MAMFWGTHNRILHQRKHEKILKFFGILLNVYREIYRCTLQVYKYLLNVILITQKCNALLVVYIDSVHIILLL